MKKSSFILAALITVAAPITLPAADRYWDINGATAGAGGATPTGNWNTSTANWTTDPLGEIDGTTWVAGDSAIFSAGTDATGTFTVTTTAAQTAASITVEEGIVQHAGSSTNTLTTSSLTINNGATFSLQIAQSFTPPAGSTLTLNGGTIQNRNGGVGSSFFTSGSANTNMGIVLGSGGGHISVTGPATAISIYTGLISGTGPLSIDGTGLFRLTTTVATYSGDTIINGRLQISTTANVLPSGTGMVINAGGVFDLQANQTIGSLNGLGSIANNIASGTRTLTVGGEASTTFDGVLGTSTGAGVVSLTRSGAGTLTLAGLNVQTGTTTLSSGGITVNPGGLLSAATAPLTVNGGTLTLNNAAQSVGKFSGSGGNVNLGSGHTLTITNAGTAGTYSGTISGPGGLVFGGGSETLSGANTYDGITTVNAGILTVGNATALGSTVGNTTVASGAELLFTGAATNFTVNEAISIAGVGGADNGAIAVIASANPTISGPITLTGDATVTVSSTASATFSNPAAFTSLANQNLTLAGGANAAGVKVIAGDINLGTGNLIKTQGGKWTLTAANTYSGTTTISAGTLELGNGLEGNDGTIANSPTILNSGALIFNRFGADSYGGAISGSGTLTKSGAGTQTLSGANSHAGATTVSAGTLKVGSATALGHGGLQTITVSATTVSSGATLDLNGTSGINEPIVLNGTGVGGNGALVNNAAGLVTTGTGIAGIKLPAATGTGSGYSSAPTIAINGTGSGALATATLGVTAASFTLDVGDKFYTTAPTVTIGGGGIGATAVAVLSGGATGTLTGISITNAGTGFTGAPTITFGTGVSTSGTINGSGTGNATEFTVSGVTVTAAGTGYTGTATYTFGSGNAAPGNATLPSVDLATDSSIGGTGNMVIDSAVSESGGARTLTKVGAGTLTLSGPQSYDSLQVDDGTATLDSSLPDANITVEGGTLNLNANATDSTLNANGGTVNIHVSQTLTALNIGPGGVVVLSNLPPAPAADEPSSFDAGGAVISADAVQAVPEAGSLSLLMFGALGLLRRRRETHSS